MKRLLLFFSLVTAAALQAQDYLITTKGDTLKGSISFAGNTKIETAIIKGTRKESISSINTREVFMRGKHYKPVQFNGKVQFMELLVDGYLSLFAFQLPNVVTYDGRLLQKRDGKLLEVAYLGFKKHASAFLSDHAILAAEIKEGKYGQKDLMEIIKQYNDFIINRTGQKKEVIQPRATDPQSIQTEAEQKSKIELLETLRLDIEKSDLPQKQDALDILIDLAEKLKTNRPIPNYLQKALKTSVDLRNEFMVRIDAIIAK